MPQRHEEAQPAPRVTQPAPPLDEPAPLPPEPAPMMPEAGFFFKICGPWKVQFPRKVSNDNYDSYLGFLIDVHSFCDSLLKSLKWLWTTPELRQIDAKSPPMATFRYFRTFIDEEVERPFPWLSRGRSCPPPQQEDTREMDMEQSFEVDYVSQLLGRSQGMSVDLTNAPQQQPNTLEIGTVKEEAKVLDESAELEPETTADSQTPAAEAAEAAPQHSQGSSFGSLGHPFLCRRPCIRFAKGNCDVGDACGYCHHSVHARYTHLDRRQRLQVRDMDSFFVVVVVVALFALFAWVPFSPNKYGLYYMI